MQFELIHTFKASPTAVMNALLDPELGQPLTERMTTIIEIETLSRTEDGDKVTLRTRYLPVPLIKKVATKEINPRWMEWVSEVTFDLKTTKGEFRNIPTTGRIANLMDNYGTMTLTDLGNGTTRRVIAGELRIKVPVLGRIAEKIIYKEAAKILDEEAAVRQSILEGK